MLFAGCGQMTDKIVVKNLYKIFGAHPEQAFSLIEKGLSKDEIFARTGSAIGVQDASFSIRAGEVFVVMGLSGSGKSTLVRMLNRLIEPTAGEVWIDGRNVLKMSMEELIALRRRDITMVFQSFALLPHLTVLENAAFGLEVARVHKTERNERAMQALEQVGLKANADSYPDELSGGMQQRVGLARALATDPSIMLMDEAFSALDPLIRREMQEELLRLQDRQERTVVFISHDLDEAMRIGDRIAMIENGQVLQVGTPREILNNPASDNVRTFFKDVDVSQVYAVGDVADPDPPTFRLDKRPSIEQTMETLASKGLQFGYVVDGNDIFRGVVSTQSLRAASNRNLEHALLADPRTLRAGVALSEALGRVAATQYPVPVIGRQRRFMGVVSRSGLLKALEKA
jgi:glycine betaine/proline transport system ATP-binding protein